MSYPVYVVPASTTLYHLFSSFDGATGASEAASNLAAGDILIYKNGSVTQRSSTAGFTLLDTDGLDFDGITGINGFSIDLSDNTDSGFYAVGSWYHVVVGPMTVDTQTVNFVACAFRIVAAEAIAGKPKVDVDGFGGSAGTFSSGRPEVNTTHAAGTAWGSGAITAASIASDAITAAKIATGAIDADAIADNAIDAGAIASDAITAAKIATGAITAAKFAAGAVDAAALAADAGTEIGTAVWATAARTLTAATNITSTGGTTVPQTGDAYARIGAAGASLTDLGGMSTTMKAQVNTEADTALADYDPPTRAELTSDVNSVFNVLKGMVLVTGTIGSTGNDTTHVHLPGLTYGNDEINSYYIVIFDVSTSEYHVRDITDWVLATELATVDTLPFTPQNATDTYWLLSAQKTVGAGGGDATEAKQDQIIGLIGTPVTDVSTDIAAVKTQTGAIETDTQDIQGRLPAALTGGGNIKADVLALNGGTQSAADLKDFADDGYDPSTNKVQGVVLTDTTTTLTNAPSDSSGVTTLLSRLTSTRAGYLDNLSAGAVATAAKLLSYFQSALRKDVTVDADIGGNYDDATDSQEAIRDRGDSAWATATGFATHTAADVWAVGTRLLTAGTNIVLAKGTGVTGFNDLSAAQVNTEADTALADAKAGYVTAIWGAVLGASKTAAQLLKIIAATTGGKASGAATTTNTFRDPDDTEDAVVATVDSDGNRTAVTYDV